MITTNTRGPVNSLIWIDQLNEFLLGFLVIYKILALHWPSPLREVFGEGFCKWITFPVCIYFSGTVIWSSLIAMTRIVYIKV
jgi:hypothetical protein